MLAIRTERPTPLPDTCLGLPVPSVADLRSPHDTQSAALTADWLAIQAGRLVAMLARMGYPQADADDAAQDAVVIGLEHCRPGKAGPTRNTRGWLNTVAFRTAGRTRKRRLPCDDSAVAAAGAPASDEAERRDEAAAVRQVVGGLRKEWRDVLVFCDLEGNTRPAAASEFGVCVGEIGRRLARARQALREALSGRGFDPAGRE